MLAYADPTGSITPTLDMTLGKTLFIIPYHFIGLMDEVRIWNTDLDDTYIANNYNKIISDPASMANLIGYYNFDEALNNQNIFDTSNMLNNGVLGDSLSANSYDPTRIASTAPLVPEPASICFLLLGGYAIRLGNRK